MANSSKPYTFQDIILELQRYWAELGCCLVQPTDIEVGAATFNPYTFLRSLGPEPWRAAWVEPSRRPTDGRYGENPFRTQYYYQYQVTIKPAPPDSQGIYLESLRRLGIDLVRHDVRFVEDDWESPTLGATGLGWEVWLDGMECTQFTYFQQVGGIELEPVSLELTYGLERVAMFIQKKDNFFDLVWSHPPGWKEPIRYGDLHKETEVQFSKFNFETADTQVLLGLFKTYETEARRLLDMRDEAGVPIQVLPGYDFVMKCSHAFNLLDARRAISVAERTAYIARIRELACRAAEGYLKYRESLGFPMLACTGG